MSWSLVNRGLELLDSDLPEKEEKQRCKEREGSQSTQRQGVRRAAHKQQQAQRRKAKAKKQLIQKRVTNALEQYRRRAKTNLIKDNLTLLRKVDRQKVSAELVDKVMHQHSKELERRSTRGQIEEEQKKTKKKKKEETSVFSDEDFEAMNKKWLQLY